MKPKLLNPWVLSQVQAPEKASTKFFFSKYKVIFILFANQFIWILKWIKSRLHTQTFMEKDLRSLQTSYCLIDNKKYSMNKGRNKLSGYRGHLNSCQYLQSLYALKEKFDSSKVTGLIKDSASQLILAGRNSKTQ